MIATIRTFRFSLVFTFLLAFVILSGVSCKENHAEDRKKARTASTINQNNKAAKHDSSPQKADTLVARKAKAVADTVPAVQASPKTPTQHKPGDLVKLNTLSPDFDYDIRYATPNNAFGVQLYDCAQCLLRYEVAQALIKANTKFKALGFHIKIFDGYRPLSVSKKMWKLNPNPSYVKNPYKGPSMHNCGTAVDLSLCNALGEELDMGTDFDYFGQKAHHAYSKLPKQVLENRKTLKRIMLESGFRSIRTEWWHYSYKKYYPAMDTPLPCDKIKNSTSD